MHVLAFLSKSCHSLVKASVDGPGQLAATASRPFSANSPALLLAVRSILFRISRGFM